MGSAGHCSTMFVGQVMVGGVVSRMVIVCMQLVLLPHWSAAVQVRAITLALPQVLLTLSLQVTGTNPQPACAVATPRMLVAPPLGDLSVLRGWRVRLRGLQG